MANFLNLFRKRQYQSITDAIGLVHHRNIISAAKKSVRNSGHDARRLRNYLEEKRAKLMKNILSGRKATVVLHSWVLPKDTKYSALVNSYESIMNEELRTAWKEIFEQWFTTERLVYRTEIDHKGNMTIDVRSVLSESEATDLLHRIAYKYNIPRDRLTVWFYQGDIEGRTPYGVYAKDSATLFKYIQENAESIRSDKHV